MIDLARHINRTLIVTFRDHGENTGTPPMVTAYGRLVQAKSTFIVLAGWLPWRADLHKDSSTTWTILTDSITRISAVEQSEILYERAKHGRKKNRR